MKITNYKLKDFLMLEDEQEVNQHLLILESLNPVEEVDDPIFPNEKVKVRSLLNIMFGELQSIRMLMKDGTPDSVCEAVGITTKLPKETVYEFTIIDFYSIYNTIINNLQMITNMEENELVVENDDPHIELVRAGERLAKFDILNLIDNLAGGDVTKWKEIESMPYITVFTKLRMNKENAAIQKDLEALQKNKMK